MTEQLEQVMISPGRVVLVTVGLGLSGIVLGGAAAGIALAIAALLHGDGRSVFDPFIWMVGGIIGGVLGAVTAPVMSWLLLRRVSLGRALLQTMVGAIVGGVIGTFLVAPPFAPLWAAFAGYTAAALRLYLVTRPSAQASPTMVPGSRTSRVQLPR
jgi:hypothetical protein